MSAKYSSLQSLLEDDMEAKKFFNSLPDYVREHISSRGNNVNSFESLRHYADNLLRGDI